MGCFLPGRNGSAFQGGNAGIARRAEIAYAHGGQGTGRALTEAGDGGVALHFRRRGADVIEREIVAFVERLQYRRRVVDQGRGEGRFNAGGKSGIAAAGQLGRQGNPAVVPNRMLFSTALNCPALPNCATTGRAPRASIL